MRRRLFLGLVAFLVLVLVGCSLAKPHGTDPRENQDATSGSDVDKEPADVVGTLPSGFLGGIVEGFYGDPWSAEDTQAIISFLGQQHLSTFVYAPKDDPFQRARWREPYPAAQLQELIVLASECRQEGVTLVYSLSPGLSIRYSDPADRALLVAKFDQLRSIGISDFMLSFDDISGKLGSADAAAFQGDLGLAQATVTNALISRETSADSQFRLVFAPTTYSGVSDNPYWRSLKANLDPRVQVIWTGPHILSATITASQVRAVQGYLGHQLVIWDNYPTNDYTYAQPPHRPQLFLGPLIGRDAEIPALVAGYWFNPMLQPRASELALATGAEYLLHPTTYDPQAAWQRALASIGGRAAASLHILAKNSASYYHANTPPADLSADIALIWQLPASADLDATAARADFAAMAGLSQGLALLPDQQLYAEISPWATVLSEQGQAGQLALKVLQNKRQGRPDAGESARLAAMIKTIKADVHSIAGNAVIDFANRVLAQ